MTDLPSRLRASVPKMIGAASAQCNDVEAVHLAADEIERLRAALKKICQHADENDGHAEVFAIAAEVLNEPQGE
jgi:hypothetical protein